MRHHRRDRGGHRLLRHVQPLRDDPPGHHRHQRRGLHRHLRRRHPQLCDGRGRRDDRRPDPGQGQRVPDGAVRHRHRVGRALQPDQRAGGRQRLLRRRRRGRRRGAEADPGRHPDPGRRSLGHGHPSGFLNNTGAETVRFLSGTGANEVTYDSYSYSLGARSTTRSSTAAATGERGAPPSPPTSPRGPPTPPPARDRPAGRRRAAPRGQRGGGVRLRRPGRRGRAHAPATGRPAGPGERARRPRHGGRGAGAGVRRARRAPVVGQVADGDPGPGARDRRQLAPGATAEGAHRVTGWVDDFFLRGEVRLVGPAPSCAATLAGRPRAGGTLVVVRDLQGDRAAGRDGRRPPATAGGWTGRSSRSSRRRAVAAATSRPTTGTHTDGAGPGVVRWAPCRVDSSQACWPPP